MSARDEHRNLWVELTICSIIGRLMVGTAAAFYVMAEVLRWFTMPTWPILVAALLGVGLYVLGEIAFQNAVSLDAEGDDERAAERAAYAEFDEPEDESGARDGDR